MNQYSEMNPPPHSHVKYLLISLMLLLSLKVHPVELNFKYYKAEEGLSSNTVYAALQDSKGFMWFGTENGLNRFDGYTFTVFQHIPRTTHSLIHNYVYSLAEDEDEHLWIGTERGVCSYDLNNKLFTTLTLTTEKGIQVDGRIQSLVHEGERLWIASARQGVFLMQSEELQLYTFEEFKIDRRSSVWVNSLYKDKENVIWVSVDNTSHQIYRFDDTTETFLPAFPDLPLEEQRQLRAYSILEDTFGTIWFGTWTNGLIGVEKRTGTITGKYLNQEGKDLILHIHQITEYEPGLLLIGSNDGLTSFRVSPVTGNRLDQHFTEPRLSNRFVYPIYKDAEGGLWIGTYYGGINYASPNRNYFTSYQHIKHENSISGHVVSCFIEDAKGNIWIGTEDGGLNELNNSNGLIRSYNQQNNGIGLSFDNVHALCIVGNELWIGTYTGGLNVMDLESREIRHYYADPNNPYSLDANNIYSIFQDGNGTVWIGTSSGINRYESDSDSFTPVRILNEFVMDIIQLGNHIWFATINRGLQRYDLLTREWREYRFEASNMQSLISNDVITLCVDEQKQLWIGTNNGLCRYDALNDTFIDEKVALPSNYICKIFSDNGLLWITTLNGLISYDPATREYRQFNQSDGLLSDLFTPNSGYKSESGRIFVGTPNGFNAFYPRQLVRNEYKPHIEITGFQLFNKPARLEEYLRSDTQQEPRLLLAHHNNSFSFEFTALSYFAPGKNRYAFKLENFDKEWNDAGNNRRATYTNIPPGDYLFRVRASNNDGVWSDEDYILAVVIKPPLWWNVWSISLYLLLILGMLIYLFHWLRTKELRKHEEMIRKIKDEKERETYRSQIEFFTNVAHEIRTPLSLIIAPLEQVMERSEVLPDSIRSDLGTMRSNSERLLTLVNQLLDFSKIEKGGIQISLSLENIDQILQSTYRRFLPLIEQKNIRFDYLSDVGNLEIMTDQENLTKAVSNLLSNAVKYARDQITLQLETSTDPTYYLISVRDNGPGLPPTAVNNIFNPFYQVAGQHKSGTGLGLFLVKSIVKALQGDIEVINEPGSGLTICLKLPIISEEEHLPQLREKRLNEDESATLDRDELHSGDICPEEESEEEKERVLLVEDDEEMLSFISRQLMSRYHVITARDGNEGIAVLEKQEVDLIITDLMMPHMDGITFCKKVKSNYMWSHIPVLMLTAKTNVGAKVDAFDVGADAYLEKPFHINYLLSRTRNLLETRKMLFRKFTQTPYASLRSIAGNEADERFLVSINEIITRNIDNPDFTVNMLATAVGISSSGLFSKIKEISGVTPNKLIQSMRLKKAAELLCEGKYRVNEVCYMVGYSNPSYFSKCFQKQFGKLPKEFVGDNREGDECAGGEE